MLIFLSSLSSPKYFPLCWWSPTESVTRRDPWLVTPGPIIESDDDTAGMRRQPEDRQAPSLPVHLELEPRLRFSVLLLMIYLISKLGYHYCLLLQLQYIIRIMALLFAIMALLLQLSFCKCPDCQWDYYSESSLLHYLHHDKDYYCTYGNTIISLIVYGIYYCYYCYYHTIFYIIVNTHYYDYYGFWEVYPFWSLISLHHWAVKHEGFRHCSGIVVAREVGWCRLKFDSFNN